MNVLLVDTAKIRRRANKKIDQYKVDADTAPFPNNFSVDTFNQVQAVTDSVVLSTN